MELNQEQNSNVLTEHEAEFQKQTTRWFAEKANFQSDSEKAHSEVILVKDSLLNSTVTRPHLHLFVCRKNTNLATAGQAAATSS
jgi:hypothetical protein